MEMIQWKSISSSSSSLPNELTTEILLRLPKKSIARFHCVSKLWLSITTDPYFISLFEIRNPRSRILLCFKEGNKFVVSSISQHNLTFDHQNPATTTDHTYRMKFPKFTHSWSLLTDSVHGLICFQKSTNTPIVWNPSTRKVITLPEPSKEVEWRSSISFFLGYDEVEGKHKVLAMPSYSRSCRVSRVITLGGGSSTQEEESSSSSWRTLKTNQKHTTNPFNDIAQCIKGFIYYLASSYENVPVIMRFDVRYEKLDAIQLPSPDIYVYRLITYEGRLACVRKGNNCKITLSILEDADENKWSSKDLLAPFDHYDRSSNISFRVEGFTHAGEFIYKPYDYHVYHKSLVVLFFDPVRNSFRRFGFKRTAYDEERLSRLFVFPNHIETHMSL